MIVYPFSFIKSAGGGFDPDAQSYIDAVIATGGTLTSDMQTAINTLVVDLKTNSLWSKIDVLMPMMGNTLASIVINAKTPTDDYYKWTNFGSSAIVSVSGLTGNGTGVLRSNFDMSGLTSVSSGSSHFSLYVSKLPNNSGGQPLNGYINTDQLPYLYFNCANYYNQVYGGLWGGPRLFTASWTPQTGFWLSNRTASNDMRFWANDTQRDSISTVPTVYDKERGFKLALLTLWWLGGGPNDLYNSEVGNPIYATATLGAGLTNTEKTNLYNIITTFNTTLNRA
jgi:hypothetical protein